MILLGAFFMVVPMMLTAALYAFMWTVLCLFPIPPDDWTQAQAFRLGPAEQVKLDHY